MDKIKLLQIVGISILFVLLNLFLRDGLRNFAAYIGEPLVVWGYQTGSSINSFGSSLANYDEIKTELIIAKAELSKLESEKALLPLLIEENRVLKEQLKIGAIYANSVEAEVLTSEYLKNDALIVNAGTSKGVKAGDVAYIGNYFLGRVAQDPLLNSSIINLIGNNQSSLQIYILSKSQINEILNVDDNLSELNIEKLANLKFDNSIKGVMLGSVNGAVVENIPITSKVEEGDYVIVNDERVGRNLLVGTIRKIESKEAEANKKAIVDPFIEVNDLRYIFIELR